MLFSLDLYCGYQLWVPHFQFVLENPLVVDEYHNEYLGEAEEATDLREDSEDWDLWLAFPSRGIINDVKANLKILELVNPPNSLVERLLIRLEMEGFLISIINSEKLQAISDEITT